MNFNNFDELIKKVNNPDYTAGDFWKSITDSLVIRPDNFDEWHGFIYSDQFKKFDMERLPFFIHHLFISDELPKVLLSSMMMEAVGGDLPFVLIPEELHISHEKFQIVKDALVHLYVNFCTASNAAASIIRSTDPELASFSDEEKELLVSATADRLKGVLKYLKSEEHSEFVYSDKWQRHESYPYFSDEENEHTVFEDLENVLKSTVDLSCVMNDPEIEKTVDEIDRAGFFGSGELSIIKYKLLHKTEPLEEKIRILSEPEHGYLVYLFEILEDLKVREKYLKDVSQQDLAMSACADSLIRSFGSLPEDFEFLGDVISGNERFFVFNYTDDSEPEKILYVSGGWPADSHEIMLPAPKKQFSLLNPEEDNWKDRVLSAAAGSAGPMFRPVEN